MASLGVVLLDVDTAAHVVSLRLQCRTLARRQHAIGLGYSLVAMEIKLTAHEAACLRSRKLA
jgi:hypothetical protein